MSRKIKKQNIIFLTVLVLCLASLVGGIVYAWKGEKITKNSNKSLASEKSSPNNKNPLLSSVNRVKIKKTNDPNILLWKSESERKNSGSTNELKIKKENILKLLQEEELCDPNFKSFWENWERELKDSTWLVKEKWWENDGRIIYSDWYENDQGEKIKELGSSKWW